MTGLRWDAQWRDRVWADLDAPWDVVVVGGGIVGAGVLREAARWGLRALLLEARDFAWGTSSRSSQLAHGGLRYLAQGHVRLTRSSVRERELLLREAAGLVEPVPFLLPLHAGQRRRELPYRPLVTAYEALAGRLPAALSSQQVRRRAPALQTEQLRGALQYTEGCTDDARLVFRVVREAGALGAVALNGAEVTGLLRTRGRVTGVRVRSAGAGADAEVSAAVVVNATGVWSDRLRQQVDGAPRMRPVRGSHLLLPHDRLPLATGVVVRSPRDGRPVSVFPWQGATLVGTTDLDHPGSLREPVRITADEVAYLLECLQAPFRSLQITADDVLSTWSGVRPIVSGSRTSSAQELRDHAVWDEGGLVTVAGGKLTTFRLAARDALRAARPHLPPPSSLRAAPATPSGTDRRLAGRYGAELAELVASAQPDDREQVATTATTWAEVRWAVQREAVTALEDLMLRRTRLGLLLPGGGEQVLDRVGEVCRTELGWDGVRWERERASYLATVRASCSLPAGTRTVSAAGAASTVTGSGPKGSPSA